MPTALMTSLASISRRVSRAAQRNSNLPYLSAASKQQLGREYLPSGFLNPLRDYMVDASSVERKGRVQNSIEILVKILATRTMMTEVCLCPKDIQKIPLLQRQIRYMARSC
jgi:hypothetical protein